MFKDLKETVSNELKERIRMMSHQIENISKETEIIEKNQIEILELKSTIIEINISLEGLNGSADMSRQKKISKLEDSPIEMNLRKRKKNEQKFRDLWDTMQHTNM